MFCPQCGSELGAEAKACASCGWTASRKKLWIILGCVVGGLFLICCGVGTVFVLKLKGNLEKHLPPIQVLLCKVQVVNYAQKHGGTLPETLEKAAAEPLKGKDGEDIRIEIQNGGPNGGQRDFWGTALRYTRNPDGTFEVRSAGPDKALDNADDLVEKGRPDEDLDALMKTLEQRFEEQVKKAVEMFGGRIRKDREPAAKPDAPAPPPAGGGK